MKKSKNLPLYHVTDAKNTIEIRLSGDILSNQVFLKIVELMKKNRERAQPKAVRFVVANGTMMMSVRYAFPSAFYKSVELEQQAQVVDLERLQNAVGM